MIMSLKQRKRKFKPRIKWNYNIDLHDCTVCTLSETKIDFLTLSEGLAPVVQNLDNAIIIIIIIIIMIVYSTFLQHKLNYKVGH